MDEMSLEQLGEQLKGFIESYKQVETALLADPQNTELQLAKSQLKEVITLTDDLYNQKTVLEVGNSSLSPSSSSINSTESIKPSPTKDEKKDDLGILRTTPKKPSPPPPPPPSSPSSILSIKKTLKYVQGDHVLACYREDGKWYPAVITFADTEKGTYVIKFDQYGNIQKDTTESNVKNMKRSKKRKKNNGNDMELVIPEKIKILPGDSDEVKLKKRKKLKALKKKRRFEKLDEERSRKKDTWKDFRKKNTRKLGFYTTTKKESIFASPDSVDGKVGVTGSGKGITKNPKFEGVIRYKPKAQIHLPASSETHL